MKRLALFGGLLALVACGGDVSDEEEDDFFSNGEGALGGNVDDGDDFVPSADAPVIIAADVYCDYTEC